MEKKVDLSDVQAVYSGPEGRLWELMMGEQIHIGGFASSMDLAEAAGIKPGTHGIDLCCCTGAGMRFLIKFCKVASMHGVDATEHVIKIGRMRSNCDPFKGKIDFILADSTAIPTASNSFDFAWGEDAWCYVNDKARLVSEVVRVVKPGGKIAFTDWIYGPVPMSLEEQMRFHAFMKFPGMETLSGYCEKLKINGCTIVHARDTGRFAPCIDLYLNMLTDQLTFDALKIIDYDTDLFESIGEEMFFAQQLAKDNKIVQSLFVAVKN